MIFEEMEALIGLEALNLKSGNSTEDKCTCQKKKMWSRPMQTEAVEAKLDECTLIYTEQILTNSMLDETAEDSILVEIEC